MSGARRIFVTGSTGYIGTGLIPVLCERGHHVLALAREESRSKVPPGCAVRTGNALDGDSYAGSLDGADTFIQLVGVSHPSPAKAQQFIDVDQRSGTEAIRVAAQNRIRHFIYISVAHPAPAMHAYIEARTACERAILESGLASTTMSNAGLCRMHFGKPILEAAAPYCAVLPWFSNRHSRMLLKVA